MPPPLLLPPPSPLLLPAKHPNDDWRPGRGSPRNDARSLLASRAPPMLKTALNAARRQPPPTLSHTNSPGPPARATNKNNFSYRVKWDGPAPPLGPVTLLAECGTAHARPKSQPIDLRPDLPSWPPEPPGVRLSQTHLIARAPSLAIFAVRHYLQLRSSAPPMVPPCPMHAAQSGCALQIARRRARWRAKTITIGAALLHLQWAQAINALASRLDYSPPTRSACAITCQRSNAPRRPRALIHSVKWPTRRSLHVAVGRRAPVGRAQGDIFISFRWLKFKSTNQTYKANERFANLMQPLRRH